MSTSAGKSVFVVDGTRTPFLKARGIGPFTASDLAVGAARILLQRFPAVKAGIEQVITGSTMPPAKEANISRIIALRLGLPASIPAHTVMRNCASGMQAVDNARQLIAAGSADLILAGGTDAMSHAPLLFTPEMTAWFAAWMAAKSWQQRAKLGLAVRPAYFKPIIALMQGLTDPMVQMSMGQTAENLAYLFNITRESMDNYAVKSHQKVMEAQKAGYFAEELVPLIAANGKVYEHDDGVRADASLEALSRLRPFFDKFYGKITAGNSSQITDGACFLLLASEAAVKRYQLPVLAVLKDTVWAGLAPEKMGLGPVYATLPLLERQALSFSDIDYWELNEAFAAQVLACQQAFQDPIFYEKEIQTKLQPAEIPWNRCNIDGGAIAQGHPVGASGARIILHLIHVLRRKQAKRGIASICIGGGQGGAMLVETV